MQVLDTYEKKYVNRIFNFRKLTLRPIGTILYYYYDIIQNRNCIIRINKIQLILCTFINLIHSDHYT